MDLQKFADTLIMAIKKKQNGYSRCGYLSVCFLAEGLKCYGYKIDCPLYQKSNGEFFNQARFDKAMDELIDKTRIKHLQMPG